jgi:hypothetical protein
MSTPEQPPTLEQNLNQETALIDWDELIKHFARGVVVLVSPELDLIDVAASMAKDNKSEVEQWLEQGMINRASDDNARDWNQRKPQFWCVVAAPWVLIQEKNEASAVH